MNHDLSLLVSLNSRRATTFEIYVSYMKEMFAMGVTHGHDIGRKVVELKCFLK
jgi:hypothetical protein